MAKLGKGEYDEALMSGEDFATAQKNKELWAAANATGDQAGKQAAQDANASLRAKYGYSGGQDGSGYEPLRQAATEVAQGGFNYANAPSYANKYQSQIDALTQKLLSRPAFSYDHTKDPLYQQYEKTYTRQGERSMQDTLGQVSARTGGLASSYATTASQQSYNNYMDALSDVIPELQQLAYNMHMDELGQKRADLSTLQGMQQNEYGMIRDAYQDSVTNWQLNQGAGQQALENSRYDDETAWDRGTYASETARKQAEQKAQTLGAAGDFSGYKALGYSDAEISLLRAAYDRELAAAHAKATTSSSGGGSRSSSGSSGSSGEQDYEGLYAAAQKSANPANYIATNYKKYGFSKVTGLSAGYKEWATGQEEPSKGYNAARAEVGNMFYNWGRQGLSNDVILDKLDNYLATAKKNKKITDADTRALVQYVSGLMKLG